MRKSGRDKFSRYKVLIIFFVKVNSFLPRKLNIKLLQLFRNTSGNKGVVIRYILFKNSAKKCGDNVMIAEGVFLYHIENMVCGNNISIHPMCYIDAAGGIVIGNDVSIAHSSSILSTNHSWENQSLPIKYNKVVKEKVMIDNDVWVGCGCRILGGVHIKSRSVIAAGAVVVSNVESNTIVGGIPSKQIKVI